MTDKNEMFLVWVDTETTGLDSQTDLLLEIGCVITDFHFHIIGTYDSVIKYPQEEVLRKCNEFALQAHTKSGLLGRIQQGKPLLQVRNELRSFIQTMLPAGNGYLAGSSVHFDRRFLSSYMPEILKLLHYRMLDVSSIKILVEGLVPDKAYPTRDPNKLHTVMGDVAGSMNELKYYLDLFKIEL